MKEEVTKTLSAITTLMGWPKAQVDDDLTIHIWEHTFFLSQVDGKWTATTLSIFSTTPITLAQEPTIRLTLIRAVLFLIAAGMEASVQMATLPENILPFPAKH